MLSKYAKELIDEFVEHGEIYSSDYDGLTLFDIMTICRIKSLCVYIWNKAHLMAIENYLDESNAILLNWQFNTIVYNRIEDILGVTFTRYVYGVVSDNRIQIDMESIPFDKMHVILQIVSTTGLISIKKSIQIISYIIENPTTSLLYDIMRLQSQIKSIMEYKFILFVFGIEKPELPCAAEQIVKHFYNSKYKYNYYVLKYVHSLDCDDLLWDTKYTEPLISFDNSHHHLDDLDHAPHYRKLINNS